MQKVVSTLNAIIAPEQNDVIIYDDNKREENQNYEPISNSNKEIMSLNNDLDINNYSISNITSLNNNEHKSTSSQNHSLNIIKNSSSMSNSSKAASANNDLDINNYLNINEYER